MLLSASVSAEEKGQAKVLNFDSKTKPSYRNGLDIIKSLQQHSTVSGNYMTQQTKDTMLRFLSPSQPFEFMNSFRYSTLIAGLRDCRAYTKRQIDSGTYDSTITQGDEGNWLAAIGYFTILDQIGSCYKLSGDANPSQNTNTIKYAIETFGFDLIQNDIRRLSALVALRNAFTHDFNLLNIPINPNHYDLQRHKFTVTVNTTNDWVVTLPSRLWNGDIEGKDFYDTTDSTFINLFGLGNLAERIYSRISILIQNDIIDLRIPPLMLINNYTFVTSHHPIK